MLSKLRQSTWLSGALLLALAVGIAAPVGALLGFRSWPFYVGLVVGAVLVMGWLERLWARRPVDTRARARSKLKVLPGGRGFELHEDEPSDKPRWLM